MKRILLLSFVLAFAVIGYSQRVYRPILVNGKTWVYENIISSQLEPAILVSCLIMRKR